MKYQKQAELIYVVKVYNSILPQIVQAFPKTDEGIKDAQMYAEIMERTNGNKYEILTTLQ